jgi:hypothetical protein
VACYASSSPNQAQKTHITIPCSPTTKKQQTQASAQLGFVPSRHLPPGRLRSISGDRCRRPPPAGGTRSRRREDLTPGADSSNPVASAPTRAPNRPATRERRRGTVRRRTPEPANPQYLLRHHQTRPTPAQGKVCSFPSRIAFICQDWGSSCACQILDTVGMYAVLLFSIGTPLLVDTSRLVCLCQMMICCPHIYYCPVLSKCFC